jgi:hypothetical protein
MIDFTNVKKWFIGSDEVAQAYLNGTYVWGKGSISRTTWTNTQAPPNMSGGQSGWSSFSLPITISGVGKIRITTTRLQQTADRTSGGITDVSYGYAYLTSSNDPVSPAKVKTLAMPKTVGNTGSVVVTLDESQTYTYYLCCQPRGYYGTNQDHYGYVPAGEYRFDIEVIG